MSILNRPNYEQVRAVLDQQDAKIKRLEDHSEALNLALESSRFTINELIKSKDRLQREREELLKECGDALHYPDCWDVDAYPTIEDALKEAVWALGCSCKECQK